VYNLTKQQQNRLLHLQSIVTSPVAKALAPFVSTVIHQGSGIGALADWTIALKDNIDIEGDIVEVGAPIFKGRRASSTASAVQRVLAAGADIVGRTRVVELCWGSWGINEHCGMARNPWDSVHVRVPGGSSSGSAVAVAANLTRAALGSDTAGSIRMPAALCGVTGFKSTIGSVPTDGMLALAPDYDSMGPLARSAQDCAALYAVLSNTPVAPVVNPTIRRSKIALLPQRSWPVSVAHPVRDAVLAAAHALANAGFEVVDLPSELDLPAFTQQAEILIAAGAGKQFETLFRKHPDRFGKAVQHRLEVALALDPNDVSTASAQRTVAALDFERAMSEFDALLLPCVPCTAPLAGDIDQGKGSTLGHFVRWVNHVGACAISLPGGLDPQGLPIGIQLVARKDCDQLLLGVAQAFQRVTRWHELTAPLAALNC
jgi:aspartyl-tRNA(Asn)/glutamyl-tRNA(Gln) amidotransferase subunit A